MAISIITPDDPVHADPFESGEPPATLAELSKLMRRAQLARSRMRERALTAEADLHRIREQARLDSERVELWQAQEDEQDSRLVALACALGEAYLRLHLEDPGLDKKSIVLPWARITSRVQQPIFHRDEPALTAWAAEHGYMRPARVPAPVVDWARLKEESELLGDGTMYVPGEGVVDGVTVMPQPVKIVAEIDDH